MLTKKPHRKNWNQIVGEIELRNVRGNEMTSWAKKLKTERYVTNEKMILKAMVMISLEQGSGPILQKTIEVPGAINLKKSAQANCLTGQTKLPDWKSESQAMPARPGKNPTSPQRKAQKMKKQRSHYQNRLTQ
jgi:hypothetical protein